MPTAIKPAALTLLLFVFWLGPTAETYARPRAQPAHERDIASCIRLAANGRTWLERTLWGLRDQEGGWIGAAVLNTNGTHDLGPLQVNTWWVPRLASLIGRPTASVRQWLRHDPCFNVQAARWIFLSALAKSRDYWRAVGIYHSPTEWRQRRYAAGVAAKLRRRYGSEIFDNDRLSVSIGARAAGRALKPHPARAMKVLTMRGGP